MTRTGQPRLIVEVGFTGPETGAYLQLDDVSRGRLDTAQLAPDDLWTDVSPYVVSVDTRQGATRMDGPALRYEGGTATVVLRNDDRRFDPTNLDGPYAPGGVTQVEPMRAIRIRAQWLDPVSGADVTYPIWRGFTADWQVTYPGPRTSIVTVPCVDAFAVFAAIDREASTPAGAGEDSGARINRILDAAGWPDSDRVIDVGDSTLQATTLANNMLAELQLTTDSELGEFWMDTQGRAVFRRRLALFEDTRSNTSQATFGGVPPELPYSDITIANDATSIYNVVSIARAGGTAQVAEDTASRTAYLTRTYRRTDLLLEADPECLEYAGALLQQTAQPELRFAAMELQPRRDTRLWDEVLGRVLGDRVTAIRRPPGIGDPIQRDVFIRGIEHHVKVGLSWTTNWTFQSAARGQFLVLDNSMLGRLDFNGLAY